MTYLGIETNYVQQTLLPKRLPYDIYMNQYCRAISACKALAGSNSNSQLCVDGHKAFYVTKYPTKSTQKEDASEYANVQKYCQTRLEEQRYELDKIN